MAKRKTQAGKAYAESMQSQGTTQDYAAVRTALAWLENAGKNAIDTLVKLSEAASNLSGVFSTVMDAGEQAFAYLAVGIAAVTAAVAYAIDIHEKLMAKLHALSKLGIDTFFVWYNAAKSRSAQMAEATGAAMASAAQKTYAYLADLSQRLFALTRSGAEATITALGRVTMWVAAELKALPGYAASAARGVSDAIRGAIATVQGWADSVASVGSQLASLAASVTGLLESAGKTFAESGASLGAMAERSGLTVEALQEIGYAAQLSGSSMEAVADAAESLDDSIARVGKGSRLAREAFAALNISAENLSGLNADERLERVATSIYEIQKSSTRAAVAQELLGTSSKELLDAFSRGPEAFRAMRREAQSLGLVMGGDAAKNAKELTQQWARVQAAMQGLWRTIGQAVAPQLIETARVMTAIVKMTVAWAKENQPLIATVFKVASAIGTVGAVLSTAGWVPMMTALGGAIYGAANAWGRFGERVLEITAVSRQALGELADWTMRSVDGIRNAILGGRLDLAAQIAWNAMALVWINGLRGLAAIVPKSIEAILLPLAAGNFADAGRAAWLGIESAWLAGLNALYPTFNRLRDWWDALMGYLEQRWNDFMAAMAGGVLTLLTTSLKVTSAIAKYDPTGMAAKANQALAGTALTDLVQTAGPGGLAARNAAIEDRMAGRKAERDAMAESARLARKAEIEMRRLEMEAIGEASRPVALEKARASARALEEAQKAAAEAAQRAEEEMQLQKADQLARQSKKFANQAPQAFVSFSAAAALAMTAGDRKERLDQERNKVLKDIWAVNEATMKAIKEANMRFA